ncbi:MAG: hypothetical protein K2W96_01470 [Gemmataceae bacterium]|nr:hypothetical protein [Gemmataceae bacterium]
MRTAVLLLLALAAPAPAQEGRTKARLLYSFEAAADLADLKRSAEGSALDAVADNGVTHGKTCARWVVKKGTDYGSMEFGPAARKGWAGFDYFAVDVYMEEGGPATLHFELWDGLTRGYPTRCTFDQKLRPGKQTLLFHIARARRNGKEGRDWDELEPKDKIDLARLTKVKLFLSPPKDRDAVLWIDNLRLLQEDAAKPKLEVPLPEGAIAFKFGSAGEKLKGFTTVAPGSKMLAGKGIVHGGTGWPDALSGTFVMAAEGEKLSFTAGVPDGTYSTYFIAGPIHRREPRSLVFRLSINGRTFTDKKPSPEEYRSTAHLSRFLDVDHDGDPANLWPDYIARMYPLHQAEVEIKDGTLTLEATNHFVSALVLVPGKAVDLGKGIDAVRRAAFAKALPTTKRDWPIRRRGDPHALAWVPAEGERVWPWTHPKRGKPSLAASLAPGGSASVQLGLTTFLPGGLDVSLALPRSVRGTVLDQRLRFDGDDASEMCLVPVSKLACRERRTKRLWLRLEASKEAGPGTVEGELWIKGGLIDLRVPLLIVVHPIKPEPLPLSLGMYYAPHAVPGLDAKKQRALWKQQLEFMRSLGMTAVPVGTGTVTGIRGGKASVSFDPTFLDLAREAGFGAHPKQYQMGTTLGLGRAIGRRMGLGAKVDQEPGVELRQPGFRALHLDALRQYKAFLDKQRLPVAVEIVDEPREVPNPWNRNLADTISYARLAKEAGLTGFVTPMGDSNAGKDYSVLADHADIISVHGGKGSAKLMARAAEKKRALWLYNTGMDRFSWGFYAWRVGAAGRWEWHFSWPEDGAKGGYPGREWFNPFTSSHGLASDAPLSYPGGILWQSAFLEAAEGITDYSYLLALQKSESKEAKAFLAALKKAIPAYPEVKGLADAGAGALVGGGIEDDARRLAPAWRKRIAGLLAKGE